jgi:protein-disulfide isomerase
MHDLLFENQPRLGGALFLELARKLGLSIPALTQALDDGQFADRVRADFSAGVRSGVNGTPTFFINGLRHDGPVEFADLVQAIDDSVGISHQGAA